VATPALRASRRDAAEALKEGGRTSSAGRRDVYVRHAFVAAQVTVAFILLAGAGGLIRSFHRVMDVDTGTAPRASSQRTCRSRPTAIPSLRG
jgi:hypothetical protein